MTISRSRAAIFGAAAAFAAASQGPAAAQEEPIRVGAVLATTGPAAASGEPQRKTLEIYTEAINADGGVLGRPLELVVYDSQGDADTARALAARLVETGAITAMIGGTTTAETLAMMPIFNEHEIPFIALAGALAIVDPVKPFVFKTPHTDKMACETIFSDLGQRGLTQVALIASTGEFGKSMRAACLEVAGDHGIAVRAEANYAPGDHGMTAQLAQIAQMEGLQALVVAGAGEGPALVTRDAAAVGLDLPIYLSHGMASPRLLERAGDAAEGVRLPSPAMPVADLLPETDPQRDVVIGYKARYEAATGEPSSLHGGYAHDGLMLLVNAIKRAGSTDPFDVRNALESTNGFIGTAGAVNMTSIDHMGLDVTALRLLQFVDGAFALVEAR